MKWYSVEWRGTITLDVGWEAVEAMNEEAAKAVFQRKHGWTRQIVAISLITGDRARALLGRI